MKIRTIAMLIALIVLPSVAQAGGKAATASANATASTVTTTSDRAMLLQAAGGGANISSNKQQYQLLSGVRAAEAKVGEQPQQTLTRMGGGKLIETKGSFVVFSSQQSASSVTSVNGISYPAAYNPRTGGIGIVSGNINVKLKNSGNAAAIAKDYGVEVVRVFAHLQTAFFRVKPGQDVVAVAASLAADARVASAEIEVIENINVPN